MCADGGGRGEDTEKEIYHQRLIKFYSPPEHMTERDFFIVKPFLIAHEVIIV